MYNSSSMILKETYPSDFILLFNGNDLRLSAAILSGGWPMHTSSSSWNIDIKPYF